MEKKIKLMVMPSEIKVALKRYKTKGMEMRWIPLKLLNEHKNHYTVVIDI